MRPQDALPDGLPVALPDAVREALLAPLVDHHCRGVRRDDLVRARFELLITEADAPAPPGTTHFDTPAGAAIRRWCAPLLDLDPHTPPAVYLARRAELGAEEVNRRMLRGAGVAAFLVETSPESPELLSVTETGRHGEAAADEIVRIEQIEHEVAETSGAGVSYISALESELADRAARAAGLASAIAHRYGLDFDPARPSRGAVIAAANRRLSDPKEPLADPVLLRHLLWTAVEVARAGGLPLQFHTGHGGPEAAPHRADPALMAGFVRALQPMGVPVILLGCRPFHRQAAHLAAAFPHVYVDVGGAPARAGADAAIGELLELAPFHKQLFGSHAHGVAETCYLGALQHRRALARALALRLAADEWSASDAARVAYMIGSGNARRVYRL
ncbi:amidohydrolase family protein [Planomonospora parontospora]|uniref:amidohydrolase family protein n=1 Tax=Planomonospora parontospora TaxID=58119 RepID=UPI001670DE59|nr:amidohydrolase family protein [Planomonospora parontospora]GGL29358.1 amidohydrolase [Planomonospora parontospora subsp. antibiotica]GII19735.1 amidohydrolase [Planomonospora parontospora subsp. antibiotica]